MQALGQHGLTRIHEGQAGGREAGFLTQDAVGGDIFPMSSLNRA